MNLAILDLEWNAAYSRKLKGYINEIIQFGSVKVNSRLEPVARFDCFVRPQVGKQMNSVTAELTSLSIDDLSGGLPYMSAVSRYKRWLGSCVLMTWGLGDIRALIENCRYFSGDLKVPFLTRYCDLQRYTQDRLGLGSAEQVGLEKAALLLGLDISGMEQHRALDDSLITLEILRKVYDEAAIAPYIETCGREFYRRMTFRTSYIRDLSDPRIEPEQLRFFCPHCGGDGQRLGDWNERNRGFRADFRCGECGRLFSGRLTIKEKYEGLSMSKKTFPTPVIEEPIEARPGSVGQMELEINEDVGVLRFPSWKSLPVTHAFSTRLGGVSKNEFAAMNLGFGRGDQDANVEENYRRFCAAAGFELESLTCGRQVHRTDIRRVGGVHRGLGIWRENDIDSADGLITNDPEVTLLIYAADCVPIYFYDPEHRAIGLSHAGWRGMAAGMPEATVRRMGEEFGSDPEKLLAAIGPSISRRSFQVDEPVAREFLKLPGSEAFVEGPVRLGENEKYYVDLQECCASQLERAGLRPENITQGELCTVENSRLVFSHRKTGGQRGSNAAMLSLKI